MPSYWWQCRECQSTSTFDQATNSRGITHFIWDELYGQEWNQEALVKDCPKCGRQSLRITYEFPRKDKVILFVNHIVGITNDDYFMQMLWETSPQHEPDASWYDFKYMNGRSVYGLNKAVVFAKDDLRRIIEMFNTKCYKLI